MSVERDESRSEFAAAYQAGTEQIVRSGYSGPKAEIPIFITPDSMKLHDLSSLVEKQQAQPFRLAAKSKLLSAQSFIDYYNRFADKRSTIFANTESASFVAILDYHDEEVGPGWGEHRAYYACPKTKEWCAWIEKNNVKMSQEEFALFIEDNLREIQHPNAAEMLEIASSLKAHTNVDFKQSIRLDNGQVQFNYTQTVNGQAGIAGQLSIPEIIELAVPPFLGGAPYAMQARFRYRITPNGLQMWYTLVRPHAITQDAVKEILQKFASEMKTGQLVEGEEPK